MTAKAETLGSVPRCDICGSERVVKKAWACFNPDSGLWELEAVSGDVQCHQCESGTQLVWTEAKQPPLRRIRELNDLFRTQGVGHGTILITSGLQAMGEAFVLAAISATQSFENFNDDNDPWGEHDFGAVELYKEKLFFKFDYYTDADLTVGSENPANEGMTYRLLTIMLASEY